MELKRFFKRVLPQHHEIRDHRHLRFLGDILHDPHIFHLTRRSVSGGVATGLFIAFMPVPGQVLISALIAILLRVNLPLAVVFVWVTNPLTIPPLFFIAYKTGAFLLNRHPLPVQFEFSLHWIETTFVQIWPSVLAGCLVLGTVAALAGYLVMQLAWRIGILRRIEARKSARNTPPD